MMPDAGGDVRPIPDPTTLTTQALVREITRVEAKFAQELAGLRELHGQRFDMIESHRKEMKTDSAKALDAAMTASSAAQDGLVKLVDDLKSRVIVLESIRMSGKEHTDYTFAIIGVLVSITVVVITVITLLHH